MGAPRASLPGETNLELKLPGPVVGTAGTAPSTWGAPAQVTFTEGAVLPVGAVTWWPVCDAVAPRATRRCRWCTYPAGARDLSAQCPWPQPAPRYSSPQTLALAEQSRASSSSSSSHVQGSGEVTFRDPDSTTVQPGWHYHQGPGGQTRGIRGGPQTQEGVLPASLAGPGASHWARSPPRAGLCVFAHSYVAGTVGYVLYTLKDLVGCAEWSWGGEEQGRPGAPVGD